MTAITTYTATIEGIDRVRAAHVAAVNAGDVAGWVDAFADDGVQMPPNCQSMVGKDMIRAWVQVFLCAFRAEFTLHVEEVQIADQWAFERGTYAITLKPGAGEGTIQDNGKHITIYQQQRDGTWLIARDIWNSDHPAPGAQ
jgi:uncharacterized protein (TIGR02246 family)